MGSQTGAGAGPLSGALQGELNFITPKFSFDPFLLALLIGKNHQPGGENSLSGYKGGMTPKHEMYALV